MVTINYHWEARDLAYPGTVEYDLVSGTGSVMVTLAYNRPNGNFDLFSREGNLITTVKADTTNQAMVLVEDMVVKILEGMAL